jgi:enoyl-CoA hydratase
MSTDKLDLGENLEFSIKKRFGIITFNRQERGNALTIEMLKNIRKALEYCQDNDRIRGVILTGKGKAFTTGLDVASIDGSDQDAIKEIEEIAGEITAILYNGKPVISAINGYAMGDGVIYALASEYRIAIKGAYFQMPEVKLGIFPGTGCVTLMSKNLGIPWTKKILLFAQKVSSELALEIGLVDQIVDSQEELMKVTMEKARFLFTKNQTVVNTIKLCANHLLDKDYKKAYDLEQEAESWYEHEDKDKFLKEFRNKFL